jgi:hypothetical protein
MPCYSNISPSYSIGTSKPVTAISPTVTGISISYRSIAFAIYRNTSIRYRNGSASDRNISAAQKISFGYSSLVKKQLCRILYRASLSATETTPPITGPSCPLQKQFRRLQDQLVRYRNNSADYRASLPATETIPPITGPACQL